VRSLVMELYYRYGVNEILGVQYGYSGFTKEGDLSPKRLTPEVVKSIHELGGSFLGSSRGPEDVTRIVDWLEAKEYPSYLQLVVMGPSMGQKIFLKKSSAVA